MNDTILSTDWHEAAPTPGVTGHLILKADRNVRIPVTVRAASPDSLWVRCEITGTTSETQLFRDDWVFSVPPKAAPGTPGSVVRKDGKLFVLTGEDIELPWYDVLTGGLWSTIKLAGATVLFDAGAVES